MYGKKKIFKVFKNENITYCPNKSFKKKSQFDIAGYFSPEGISNSVTSLAEAQMRNGKKSGHNFFFLIGKSSFRKYILGRITHVLSSFFLL